MTTTSPAGLAAPPDGHPVSDLVGGGTRSPATDAAAALLDQLIARGVRDVVLSPGSRSQALALAVADAEERGLLRLHVRIDERVAGGGTTRSTSPGADVTKARQGRGVNGTSRWSSVAAFRTRAGAFGGIDPLRRCSAAPSWRVERPRLSQVIGKRV